MEELKLTPKELKQLIDNSKKINSGAFGTVFEYDDYLIKLDGIFSNLLHVNDEKFADSVWLHHYGLHIPELAKPEQINVKNLGNAKQIEFLASKQKDIILTQLPKGIVRVGQTIPGVIIPYHRDHKDFSEIPENDHKLLLQLLRKTLLAVKELGDNEIAQLDLVHYSRWTPKDRGYNILYKEFTPQIIDMDGRLVKCGEDFEDATAMYNQFGDLVLGFFTKYGLTTEINDEMINDESKAKELIDELEYKLSKKR